MSPVSTLSALAVSMLALGSVAAGPAAALSGPQSRAIENVAQVVAGTETCPDYRANLGTMTLLSLRFGFRFDEPEVRIALEERALFHAVRIKGRTAEDICAALLRLFGPEGSNVRNLVVRK